MTAPMRAPKKSNAQVADKLRWKALQAVQSGKYERALELLSQSQAKKDAK